LNTAQTGGAWPISGICGQYSLGQSATNFFALQEPVNRAPVAAVTDSTKAALVNLSAGKGGLAAQAMIAVKAGFADPTNAKVKAVADADNLSTVLPTAPMNLSGITGACPPDAAGADPRCDRLTYTLSGPLGMNPFTGENNITFTISSPAAAVDQKGRSAGGVITWNTARGVTVTFDPATGEVRLPVNLQGAGNLSLVVTDQLGLASSAAIPYSVAGTINPGGGGNPTSATVTAGASANFTVDADSKGAPGFTGKAVFTCAQTQQMTNNGISCAFSSAPPGASGSSATVKLQSGAPDVQLSLIVNTTAVQIAAVAPKAPIQQSSGSSNRLLVAMLATTGLPIFGVVLVGGIRRRNWKLVLLAAALALVVMLSDCGGVNTFKPNNNTTVSATQAGTYQVVVNVTYTPDNPGDAAPVPETRTYTVTVK
jgi:hypothetical protein